MTILLLLCASMYSAEVSQCIPCDVYKNSSQAGLDFLEMDKHCSRLQMLAALKKYCAQYCVSGQNAPGVCHYRCGDICQHLLKLPTLLFSSKLRQWILACVRETAE